MRSSFDLSLIREAEIRCEWGRLREDSRSTGPSGVFSEPPDRA